MTASTAWRLSVAASAGGQYLQFAELAFLDEAQAVLSAGGTASASSEYNATYSAAKAFDGLTSTEWATVLGGFPAWIGYTRPTAFEPRLVRIVNSTMSGAYMPRELSDVALERLDGATWVHHARLAIRSGTWGQGKEVILAPLDLSALTGIVSSPVIAWKGAEVPAGMSAAGCVVARDMELGGRARISGTVGIAGQGGAPDTMVKSRVRLLRQRDGLLARETWSDPHTGAFAFDGLDERQQFIAMAEDGSGVYAPVAADRRLAEVAP